MAWLRVFALAPVVWLAKLVAPIAVLFVDRKNHPVWGNSHRYISYWDSANPFGNAAHNLFRYPMPAYTSTTNTPDATLEYLDGFQWRRCESADGKYVSFRCTWGKQRTAKGKREFYIGWTMRHPAFEDGTMSLSFFQFRPF
jgi:hypothetical protein